MKKADIVRAWKDEDYRLGLSAEEQAALPDSPVGTVELSDLDLEDVAGGKTEIFWSLGCCGGLTQATCWGNCTADCGP